MQSVALTYSKSGVDIHKAEFLVAWLKKLKTSPALGTLEKGIGPFASVFKIPSSIKDPLIVTACDGVGTKLEVARMAGDFTGVGVDLVAMNVNDVICSFATPVIFLDYFAASKLEPHVFKQVLSGIARGCRQAGCALAGGETAEMPGFYREGQVELVGFCVGLASERELKRIPPCEPGDVIIGFPSSGFHSNGYSLLRKLLFEIKKFKLSDTFPGSRKTVKDVLLTPTRIYVKTAQLLQSKGLVSAFVHVTGGGIKENLKRVLPPSCRAEVSKSSWRVPRIFLEVQAMAGIDDDEAFKTFNMGMGFIAVIKRKRLREAERILKEHRKSFKIIGEITAGKREVVIS